MPLGSPSAAEPREVSGVNDLFSVLTRMSDSDVEGLLDDVIDEPIQAE